MDGPCVAEFFPRIFRFFRVRSGLFVRCLLQEPDQRGDVLETRNPPPCGGGGSAVGIVMAHGQPMEDVTPKEIRPRRRRRGVVAVVLVAADQKDDVAAPSGERAQKVPFGTVQGGPFAGPVDGRSSAGSIHPALVERDPCGHPPLLDARCRQ